MAHPLFSGRFSLLPSGRNSPSQSYSSIDALTPLWKYKTDEIKMASDKIKHAEKHHETDEGAVSIHSKITEHLDAFTQSPEYEYYAASMRGDPCFVQKTQQENLLLKCFETVLTLCQVDFNIYSEIKQDSAICILPIDPSDLAFNQYITILLLQIPKFPPTFLNKLNIRLFSFCKSVSLENPSHKELYYKRVLSGLFEVEKCKGPAAIRLHFYKFICYHIALKSKEGAFASAWKKLNPPEFVYLKEAERYAAKFGMKGFLNVECMKSPQADQAIVLEKLLSDDKKLFAHPDEIVRDKAKFMMDSIMKIDPNFSALKGWRKGF